MRSPRPTSTVSPCPTRWTLPVCVGCARMAIRVRDEEQRAVVMGNISAGIFELLTWHARSAAMPTPIGVPARQSPPVQLMDRCSQMQLAYWEKALAEVGDVIDVAQIADDVAGQQGLLISPRQLSQAAQAATQRAV